MLQLTNQSTNKIKSFLVLFYYCFVFVLFYIYKQNEDEITESSITAEVKLFVVHRLVAKLFEKLGKDVGVVVSRLAGYRVDDVVQLVDHLLDVVLRGLVDRLVQLLDEHDVALDGRVAFVQRVHHVRLVEVHLEVPVELHADDLHLTRRIVHLFDYLSDGHAERRLLEACNLLRHYSDGFRKDAPW